MISEINSSFCTHFSGKVSFVLYAADRVMEPTGVPIEPTLKDWKPWYNKVKNMERLILDTDRHIPLYFFYTSKSWEFGSISTLTLYRLVVVTYIVQTDRLGDAIH